MSKNNDKFFDDLRTDFEDLFDDEELKELSDDLDNKIVLNDEQGNEIEFEFLDLITFRGDEFVVLLPSDEEDAGEVVILMVEDTDDDEESYTSVDDEETLNAVFNIFRDKFQDTFNFVD